MNPFFDWLKDSGTQAVLILVGTIAACFAAFFSWMAPSKKDLARVEANTAATSGHLENVHQSLTAQERRDALTDRAQHVSMTASGRTDVNCPMEMTIALRDPDIVLTRVGLYNEAGNLFGTFESKVFQPLYWKVNIPTHNFQSWFSGGKIDQINTRKLVKLRVFMLIDGLELHQDFAVYILNQSQGFNLDGSC
jgi:hypothetical protein